MEVVTGSGERRMLQIDDAATSGNIEVKDLPGGETTIRVRGVALDTSGDGAVDGGAGGAAAAPATAGPPKRTPRLQQHQETPRQPGKLLGPWSPACRLRLPSIAPLPAPICVTLPANRLQVRWRRPDLVDVHLSRYDVQIHEADSDGRLLRHSSSGKEQWRAFTCEELHSRPTVEASLPPLKTYVARVRAFGTASKDGVTKLQTEWSPNSAPVAMVRKTGGGYMTIMSAATEEAVARARRRSRASSSRDSVRSSGAGDDGGDGRNRRMESVKEVAVEAMRAARRAQGDSEARQDDAHPMAPAMAPAAAPSSADSQSDSDS